MTNLSTLIVEVSTFFYTRNQNESAIFMKNSLENCLVYLMNQYISDFLNFNHVDPLFYDIILRVCKCICKMSNMFLLCFR